ncbi:MAG: hypothetical protein ACTSR3_01070 [Candidatus Helarchaeota archaeon]
MIEILEYLAWFFILFSFAGAWLTSGTKPSRKDILIANSLYCVTNLYGIIFMFFNFHWAYFLRNMVFLMIGIRGVIKNIERREKNKRI